MVLCFSSNGMKNAAREEREQHHSMRRLLRMTILSIICSLLSRQVKQTFKTSIDGISGTKYLITNN